MGYSPASWFMARGIRRKIVKETRTYLDVYEVVACQGVSQKGKKVNERKGAATSGDGDGLQRTIGVEISRALREEILAMLEAVSMMSKGKGRITTSGRESVVVAKGVRLGRVGRSGKVGRRRYD